MIEFTSIKSSTKSKGEGDKEEDAAAATSCYYDNSGGGSLQLEYEDISKDGTWKRAYKLRDGQLIESVMANNNRQQLPQIEITKQQKCNQEQEEK